MRLDRLWLSDFRNYEAAELAPSPSGLTVIHGANGEGKTNLLEAVGYLATLSSFRGAPAEALVRVGADSAVVRAEGEREGRSLLIEASLLSHDRIGVATSSGWGCPARAPVKVTVYGPPALPETVTLLPMVERACRAACTELAPVAGADRNEAPIFVMT